ncbi:MAG: hypothetical protein IIC13_07340 [SAR324 cluster bacterium]|nr:hypothetical protein [SAR324 cluster bacterium]
MSDPLHTLKKDGRKQGRHTRMVLHFAGMTGHYLADHALPEQDRRGHSKKAPKNGTKKRHRKTGRP